MPPDESPARVDHRSEAAFHVRGAAAGQSAALDDGRERVDLPLLTRPGRHDVRVAGEDERGGRAAMARPEVVDGAELQALDREAGTLEQLADEDLAIGIGRRYGRLADQLAREAQRVHRSRIVRCFIGL